MVRKKLRVSNDCTNNALGVTGIKYATIVITLFESPCLAYPVPCVELNDCLLTILMYLMGCANVPQGCVKLPQGVRQPTLFTGQVGAVEEVSDNGQYHKYYNLEWGYVYQVDVPYLRHLKKKLIKMKIALTLPLPISPPPSPPPHPPTIGH